MHLFFPTSEEGLEAEPDESSLRKFGIPMFVNFHPIGRPLPTPTDAQIALDRRLRELRGIRKNGLGLFIPPSIDALISIKARFVLAPEKSLDK